MLTDQNKRAFKAVREGMRAAAANGQNEEYEHLADIETTLVELAIAAGVSPLAIGDAQNGY